MTCQASFSTISASIIRHGESEFNCAMDKFADCFPLEDAHSDRAKNSFQFNRKLLDAPLNQEGRNQAIKARQAFNFSQVEAVFVSPLRRTLETANIIFGDKNIKIVVLPNITQILSKICDISSSIADKRKQFPSMDFSLFSGVENTWQLDLLSAEQFQFSRQTLGTQPTQREVTNHCLQLLQRNFPHSIEPRVSCSERITSSKVRISALCHEMRVTRIAIVAHKRVLIEMTKSLAEPQGFLMKNCELRKIQF